MLKLIRSSYFISLLSVFCIISSCTTFDPPVVVPAYGHIDSIHFSVPNDSINIVGTASNQISYAWVYLDDNPVGAFQMPCTFPMIASNGVHNIKIYPGVTPAAGTSPASMYPFYQFYNINVNLQQGATTKFQPTSNYYNWVKFPCLENFEENTVYPTHIINYHGASKTVSSDTTMIITRNNSLTFDRSSGSGMVIIDQNHPYYIGMTDPWDSLPTNGSSPVYVELNYKSTALFSIGLFEQDTVTQVLLGLVVYPSPTWNKLYVVLEPTLAQYSIEPYRIFFTMQHTSDAADTLLLDNIKILD